MLGILLIYYIGKYFYVLAGERGKSKTIQWTFAVLGVVVYYLGTFVGGMLLGVLGYAFELFDIETMNDFLISLLALPFGVLACWGFYMILKNNWKTEHDTYINDDNILDANL